MSTRSGSESSSTVPGIADCLSIVLGGSALYFHSRPFFQQGDGGGVIQVLMAVFDGDVVNFFHGFERGKLYPDFFCGFEHQADIFVHQPQRKVGSEIAIQNEWRLVFDDPERTMDA